MSMFPIAVLSVFLHQRAGFGLTEIMLLQAVFGLVMLVFEFPSGYLADRIGYRRSLIIACGLWVIAWPIYGESTTWVGVVIAESLLAIGLSLVSGCDTALLYESLLAGDREQDYARWSGRLMFCGQVAAGVAALIAGWLFARDPAWPFWAQAIASLIALVVALSLIEPARVEPPFTDSLAQIRGMIRRVAIEDRALRALIVVMVALGLGSFVAVWTIQLYALDSGLPQVWLGPMWAVANVTVAAAALFGHRLLGRARLATIVAVCGVLIVAAYLGMGLITALGGFAFYYLLTIVRGMQMPLLEHRELRLLPSGERAGFASLRSATFRAGFLLLGPLVGLAIDEHGQHPILLALALGFAGVTVGLLVLVRRVEPRATVSA
jgi:MFS family permease